MIRSKFLSKLNLARALLLYRLIEFIRDIIKIFFYTLEFVFGLNKYVLRIINGFFFEERNLKIIRSMSRNINYVFGHTLQ